MKIRLLNGSENAKQFGIVLCPILKTSNGALRMWKVNLRQEEASLFWIQTIRAEPVTNKAENGLHQPLESDTKNQSKKLLRLPTDFTTFLHK